MANKYRWRETATPQNQQTTQPKYRWRESNAQNTATDITNRLNSWLKNYEGYVSDYQTRFGNRKGTYEDAYVSDSAAWLENINKQKSDFAAEADSILSDINKYQDYLDKDWVKSVQKTIAGAIDQQNQIANIAAQDDAYWESFGTEDMLKQYGSAEGAYKAKQQENADYEEKSQANLSVLRQEIAELEKATQEYATVANQYNAFSNRALYGSEEGRALADKYNALEDLNKQLQEKRKYYDDAKFIQDYASYMENAKADNFGVDSQFNSTRTEASLDDATYMFGNTFAYDTSVLFGDFLYDYVNKQKTAVDVAKSNNVADFSKLTGHNNEFLETLTSDEIRVFNYLYKTKSPESAKAFLDFLEADLEGRRRVKEQAFYAQQAEESPFKMSVISTLMAPLKGVSYLGQAMDMMDDGKLKENAGYNRLSYIPSTIRSQVASTIENGKWGKVGSFAYNTGMSMADFLFTTAVSGGNQALSLAIMGTGAAADATLAAKDRGLSDGQAFALGTIAGLAEIAMEKISLGAWLNGDMTEGALKYWLSNTFSEGLEETGTSAINLLADVIIAGDKSEWKTAMQDYIDRDIAKNKAEAFGLVAADQAKQMGLDALGGMLSGSTIGGGTYAGASISANFQYGGLAKNNAFTTSLTTEGVKLNPDSKYIQKLNTKAEKGKNLTGMQVRNILAANQDAITANDMQKIQQAAEKRLTDLGQTKDVSKVAELATKYATGQKLTRAETSILSRSEYGSKVAHDLLQDSVVQEVNAENYGSKAIRSVLDKMASATYTPLDDRVGDKRTFKVSEDKQATDSKTGDKVSLDGVEVVRVGKGGMTLKVDGKEVKASDIEYASGDQSYLYEAVSKIENITPEAATAIINGYDLNGKQSVSAYLNGIDEAYQHGYYGYDKGKMGQSKFASKLTEEQSNKIYEIGRNASKSSTESADVEKKNAGAKQTEQEKEARLKSGIEGNNTEVYYRDGKKVVKFDKSGKKYDAKRMAAVNTAKFLSKLGIGGKFYFYESYMKDGVRVYKDLNGNEVAAPNGIYMEKDGSIHIDLNAGNRGQGTALFTLGHELTHFVKAQSAKQFKVLSDLVAEAFDKTDLSMHERVLEKQKFLENKYGEPVSYSLAHEEVMADSLSTMLSDGSFYDLVMEIKVKDKGLFRTIKLFFKHLVEKFTSEYAKLTPDQRDAQDIRQMKDMFNKIQKVFAEALVEASDNFQATQAQKNTTEDGGVDGEYDIKLSPRMEEAFKPYAKKINSVVNQSISGKGNIDGKAQMKDIMPTGPKITAMVATSSEGAIDISQKSIALSSSDIWHEYKRHTQVKPEVSRGQVAFTKRQFQNAVKCIISPDMVETIFTNTNNPTQRQSFAYAKKTSRGNYVVVEAVGGKKNPRIYPVMILQFSKAKWDKMMAQGKTLGEVLYDGDDAMLQALDIRQNKKSRVTAAQFASYEAIASTLRSPQLDTKVSQPDAEVKKNSVRETDRYIAKSTIKYGDVEKVAIEHFGTTDNFRTAGYILRDGQMLDFSGAHWLDGESDSYIADWKKKNDIRQVDHEDIFEAFEISANDFPNDSRKEFINRGNIRVSPEAPGINIAAEPTAEQYQVIRDLIKSNPYNAQGFYVDIENKSKRIDKIVYSGNVNADRVVNDIKHFFQTGEVREPSGLTGFLRSDRDFSDAQFSLREPVEESKDLLAYHNITLQLLLDVLSRKSLLMPSLAITNKGMTDFGAISLLFDKATIDPIINALNKLYGSDAWTPTQTKLKKNAKFDTDKTVNAVNSIKSSIGSKYVSDLFNITAKQFRDAIIKADGSIYDAYAHNIGVQTAYAMEKGIISEIPTKNGSVDKSALQKQLNSELDTDNGWRQYKRWLNNISDTIITSYDQATNEDILKNMKAQPATAKQFKLSETGELVVPAVEYSSIDEVRKNKNRLSENAAEATKAVADEFLSLAKKIGNTQQVVDAINASFDSRYSVADIVRSFNKKGIKITTKTAGELQALYKKAVELPTQYFEAKPGREVGLDEIKAVVMPTGTEYAELKSKLEDLGIQVVEYDGSNESRVEALNSMENLKFSERDSDYLDAVNRGDMETAQKMVNEAARFAEYDATMFHETDAENIHIFDISRGTHGGTDYQTPYGIFTKTSSKNIGLGKRQMKLFVKAHNTLRVENREDVLNKIPGFAKFYDQIQAIDKKYDALANQLEDEELDALYEWMEEHPDVDMDEVFPTEYIAEGKPADIDSTKYLEAHERYMKNRTKWEETYNAVAVKAKEFITSYLRNNGYDSMYFVVDGGSRGRQTDSLIVLDENQVKSADPVTYDDDGNVIPLSQRFNAENDDIRYSERGEDTSNRALLANAFETISKSSVEYKDIQEYRKQIKVLNLLENELSELNQQIHEIRFTKGKYDAQKLKALEQKAERIAADITRQDKVLFNMEASAPLRKVIEYERKKAAKQTREHIAEIVKSKADKMQQTELRHKIRKTVRDLDKLLNKGNKKQNVKEDMQGFVSKALYLADYLFTDHISNDELIRRGIDPDLATASGKTQLVKETEDILTKLYDETDSLTDEEFTRLDAKRKENEAKLRDLLTAQRNKRLSTPVYKLFNDLVTEYASLENASQEAVRAAYSEDLENSLRAFISDDERVEILNNMRVADMTTEELNWLYRAYTMVLHSVRKANTLFVEGKTQSTDQMANRIAEDFAKRKMPDKKAATVIRNLSNKLGWSYEKLYYALDRIGSEAFTELVMNIANSENIVMQDVIEAVAYRDEIVKKYGFNDWNYNKEIDRDFLDATGKKFRLTLGQLMSLYAYSRRDGAWDHIEYGGFSFKDTPITENNSAASYKLSKEQCEAITNTLTDKQKAYVEDMQKFLSETMGAKGNEVSLLLYGIKMFKEKNYFPIHIDGRFQAKANESQAKAAAGFSTMTNAGFTHAQNPNAKAPFLLESFNEVWADHVNEMSRYHGTVPALEDFRRVMNRTSYMTSTENSTSMYAALENSFGKEAAAYFQDLYREANSGAIADKMQKLPKKFLSLFRKNSVAYSLSVVIQQPSAMKRAYAMINPKYFGFKGFFPLTSGVVKAATSKWNPRYAKYYNEMLKYAPGVTMAKEIGGFDTHTGSSIREYLLDTEKSFKQSMKTENLKGKGKAVLDLVDNNAIANLPNVADKIAWIEIWNACKKETVAKHKDLATNSEEFMQIVGKRFTEVIRATQVYDSIFAKSPMLKNKHLAVQYLVSFMNEPNTTANMMEKAVRDIINGKNGKWKDGARTAFFVAYSILWNNVLKSIVYAMRDDDEDETYIEKYLSALTGGLFDDVLPMNYIPFVRDAWSVLQGYDVERADMAIVSDAINSLNAVIKNAFTETEEMTEEQLIEFDKKVTDANWKLVGSLTAFLGIPVKNVYREVDGIISHIKIASKNAGMTTVDSLLDKVRDGVIESIPFVKTPTKTNDLYDAIVSGDTKYIERIKGTYKTEDSYTTAVRKALRENDPRIHDAAQARVDGNTEEYKRIFREIQKEGKFGFDDIMSAINSEENKILKKTEPEKVTSDYSATSYIEAIADGDESAAETAKEDIIDAKVANGKSRDVAEREFKSSLTTAIRDVYFTGLMDEAQAKNILMEYAGKDEEEADSYVSYWSYLDDHPEYEKYSLTKSNVEKYLEFAEPENIPMDVFVQYRDQAKGIEDIKDEYGDVTKSAREQKVDIIDSLPLTDRQKDAMYLAAGLPESKSWDVPW